MVHSDETAFLAYHVSVRVVHGDILVPFEAFFLLYQLVLGVRTRTEKQIYSDMNVGHGRPRFQNVKLISYGSTSCNFFKYLSLASLDCKLSKYLDKNNSGRLSRRFRCAYFRCHFLLKLSKQLEVVLQFAHSNCCHRR